jgi:hypothetical protein
MLTGGNAPRGANIANNAFWPRAIGADLGATADSFNFKTEADMAYRLIAWVAGLVALMQLAACSKTVEWEEEVPLNTGETIVVKRSGKYRYESESGNPLKYGYSPDWTSTIEFTYRGKFYSYTGDASLILLAIGPDGNPSLVADAANHDWQWRNRYFCVTPYYVQFQPDQTGKQWRWPDEIDDWLYRLPTNLIFGLPPVSSSDRRFLQADRTQINASIASQYKEMKSIDAEYSTKVCPKRNS